MRRISHNQDWGFTPVLEDKNLYPTNRAVSVKYLPTRVQDAILGRYLDVVIGEKQIKIIESSMFNFLPINHTISSFKISDYIGVAVQYGFKDQLVHPFQFNFIKQVKQRVLEGFNDFDEEVVTLYLMHEERENDLLLYYASHQDELIAQWQFWSKKLSLPSLTVAADGFVDEPFNKIGQVLSAPPQNRLKDYSLYQRRPRFSRVRNVGYQRSSHILRGREIMARN